MRVNIEQIEHSVKQLPALKQSQEFSFAFLRAFGEPETTITRLKQGDYNPAEHAGEVLLRRKKFFKIATDRECYVMFNWSYPLQKLPTERQLHKTKIMR